MNELVASHEPANNAVINLETKTEHEITELSKEYSEIIEKLEEIETVLEKDSAESASNASEERKPIEKR